MRCFRIFTALCAGFLLVLYIIGFGPRYNQHYEGVYRFAFEGMEFRGENDSLNYALFDEKLSDRASALIVDRSELSAMYERDGYVDFSIVLLADRTHYGSWGHFGFWPYSLVVREVTALKPMVPDGLD